MNRKNAVSFAIPAVMVFLIVAAGASIFLSVDWEEQRAFNERASEWCEAENGTLVNSQTVGGHGGLHCFGIGEGENMIEGEGVHMADAAALNWTHDVDAIQQRTHERTTGPFGIVPQWIFHALVLGAVVVALVFAHAIIGPRI